MPAGVPGESMMMTIRKKAREGQYNVTLKRLGGGATGTRPECVPMDLDFII